MGVGEEWTLDIAYQGVKGHGWRKILVILDLGSRTCIDLEQFGEITGLDFVGQLEKDGRIHGLPKKIRTDNVKEFICREQRELSVRGMAWCIPGSGLAIPRTSC